jgi:hypothetical protein
MAGTLKVSKKIWAACSRFEWGLRGASVRRTGCCVVQMRMEAEWRERERWGEGRGCAEVASGGRKGPSKRG